MDMSLDPVDIDLTDWAGINDRIERAQEAKADALALEGALFMEGVLAAHHRTSREWTMCPDGSAPTKQVLFDITTNAMPKGSDTKLYTIVLTIVGRALRGEPVPDDERVEIMQFIQAARDIHVRDMDQWVFQKGNK